MGSEPEADSRPRLSPGRIRALSIFARIEFGTAWLLSVALCAARLTVFTTDSGPLWALLGVVVLPAYAMATVLTFVHAKHVARPLPAIWPELAFWAVAPAAATGLLGITAC